MPKKDLLKKYKAKRDFKKTPEPAGGRTLKKKFPSFVIQKHDARRLHYDFRLEADGVLKSWAVPKGPSLDVHEKRLAVPTEDHPMDYGSFEGNIPKGEYGGGSVIVWDSGYYINLTEKNGKKYTVSEGIRHGHLRIWMEGKKIKGGFSLTRMGPEGRPWLLVKMPDNEAKRRDPVKNQPRSVLTGRSNDEVAKGAKK
jgi:DNA ligase D-like protein (predicted 3'-phosphoesterase)